MRSSHALRPAARRSVLAAAGLLTVALATAGCQTEGRQVAGGARADGTGVAAVQTPNATPKAKVHSNLPRGNRPVHVDKRLRVRASGGKLRGVRVTAGSRKKPLRGHMSHDRSHWVSTGRFEPGLKYRLHAVAVNADGAKSTKSRTFRTDNLTLDQQTYPSIAPLPNQTVGVGMPVIVHFDVAVTNKASIEKHLSVQTSPHQIGAWHWISDNEVHWRPKHYWRPGTTVTVNADVNSVPAGHGIYGQLNNSTTFHIGDKVVSHVNIATDKMNVFINNKLARSIPVTAGMPGFVTRSGIKVIIEKDRRTQMNASSIGIKPGSPNYYNLTVYYAMRVTYSGEFVHAAPWSQADQGLANVSHGCVGMSTTNAIWLYNLSKVGDVVDVTGSSRHMTLTNGWGDWNESFAQYKKGSALASSRS